MAIKQGHQTYSGNSSGMGSSSSAIIVLLTLGIIIGLVVAGFFMMGQIADTSSEGIDVFVQISGNDVLIILISGGNVNQITDICVYVDGYTSPEKKHSSQKPAGVNSHTVCRTCSGSDRLCIRHCGSNLYGGNRDGH